MLEAILAKKWKNEIVDLATGRHYIDEEIVVRVTGSVEKRDDQFVAPTVSIPLIPTLALLIEKMGVTRDHALRMLREAVSESMIEGINEDASIKERISDVEKAIATVRTDLIDKLPKMKRSGRLVLDDLEVEVTDVSVCRLVVGAAA